MSSTNYENAATFDGIRGVAFILVLSIHSVALNIPSSGTHLQGTGKYGVWLFFVLSAFLLTRNYIIPDRSKLAYTVSRVIRIVPLYLIACFVYHAAGVFIIPFDQWERVAVVLYGPGHLWTIPVEFYFYFFLLALWSTLRKPSHRDCAFITASVFSLAALALLDKANNSLNFFWFLPSFLVGYLLARVWPNLRKPTATEVVAGVALVVCTLVLLSPGVRFKVFGIAPSPYLMNWYLPISIVWAIFIYLVGKSTSGLIHKAIASAPLAFCGRVSYSGYLFHWLIIEKVKLLGFVPLAAVFVSIIMSLLLAYASYKLIERPLLSWRTTVLHQTARA